MADHIGNEVSLEPEVILTVKHEVCFVKIFLPVMLKFWYSFSIFQSELSHFHSWL